MSGIDAPADPHVPYPSAPDGSEAKAAQVDGVEKEAAVAVKPGDAGAAPAAAGDATEKPAAERPVVSISELFQYADGVDRALMIIGGVGAFINGAGMPAFADVFGRMIDELVGSPEEMEKNMAFLAALMCYIGIGVFALSALQVACYMVSSSRQVARIRRRYFAAVVRQEVAWHDEHKPGALAARLVGDTKLIQAGINDKLAGGMMNFGMFIFGFGLGFFHSWELTLVMFGTMPLIALTGGIMEHVLTKMTVVSRQGFANAGEVATEAMDNIRTVQVFGTEEKEVARFAKRLAPARIAGIRKEFTASAGIGLSYCIIFSSYSVAFWFASYLIEWKRNTVGEIMAVFFSVLMGSFGMGLMFPSFTSLTEARAAAYSIYEVINRKIAIDVDAPGASIEEIKDGITFEHVAFSYPTRKDMTLFTDLNVTIPKGAKVAFSGASGCGKSSIVGLLQRFYDPDSGSVRVDGVDMRDLQVREWRSLIGIVSQEPSLFSGSVKENIRLGKPDATDAEIEEACRKANIHDTIMTLPKQYDTPVGNVGSQLSGGQKQRIAIARAIIKNPKLLILDEATSALDRKSEVEVQAALDEVMQSSGGEKLTVVIIAHRLATIRNVDCIHYITYDGETGSAIAESGTYDELMARGGHFAIMASRQQQEDESASPTKSPGTMLPSASSPSNGAAVASGGEEGALVTPSALAAGKRPRVLDDDEVRKQKTLEELMAEEIERANAPMSRVAGLVDQKWAVAIGLVGSVISGGLYPAYAVVLAKMLEVLGQKADKPTELREETPLWAGLFLAIGGGAFLGWCLQGFYGIAGEHMTEKIRIMLYRAILRQDATFFDTPGRDPGSLSGLLGGDTESVHMLFGPSIGLKVQMACNVVVGIIIAMFYSWKLALVTIACIPLMILAGAVNQLVVMGVGIGRSSSGMTEDTIVAESLNNIRTVVSFNFQERQSATYEAMVDETLPAQRNTGVLSGAIFGFSQFTFYGVFALAFWYGSKLIVEDGLSFTDIMIASMAVLMGAMGAGEAGGFAAKTVEAGAAAKRVFAVIDRVPKVDAQTEGRVKDIGPGASIELHHVHFRYPARPAAIVLDGLSVNFEDRKSVGLIGSTGCGKSTIMQLLCRFYDPEHGKILINGHNLRDVDVRTWRKECSIVLQEPALFSGTVRENITYGVDDEASVTDEEVEQVARWAAIYDDVMKMPDGFNTQVGYKGRQLSGGQKQRVAIARGLLRKPRLMFFDEATSALDAATERRVMEGIVAAAAAHPMGMLSIAHRLTTIEKSDKIVVLDAGEIIEEGSHGELMAIEGGEYRKRYTLFVQGMEAASALTSPSAAAVH